MEAEQAQLQKERAELRAQGEAERSHYYEQLRQDRAAAQLGESEAALNAKAAAANAELRAGREVQP